MSLQPRRPTFNEADFKRQLRSGYQRNRAFYEGAGCERILKQMEHTEFVDAVRRYKARFRLGALGAIRDANT